MYNSTKLPAHFRLPEKSNTSPLGVGLAEVGLAEVGSKQEKRKPGGTGLIEYL